MALTNEELLKQEGNLVDEVAHQKMKPFIDRAVMDMKRLLPDYADLESDAKGNNPSEKARACQKAETLLALSYSIIPLNTRASQKGGFVQAIGMKEGGTQLLSYDDAQKLAEYYRNQAMDILKDWVENVSLVREGNGTVSAEGITLTVV